jgi:ATP-dependent protease Clp ATPase subunit
VLLDVMYEIPSRPEVRHVVVGEATILGEAPPRLLDATGRDLGQASDRAQFEAA